LEDVIKTSSILNDEKKQGFHCLKAIRIYFDEKKKSVGDDNI
jgi:hypothetical protein